MNAQVQDITSEIADLRRKAAELEAVERSRLIQWVEMKAAGRDGELKKPIPCEENTQALLDYYGVTCRYNEMSKDLDIYIPNESFQSDTKLNAEIEKILDFARKNDYPESVISGHLVLIGNRNAYHPVVDWIVSEPWDRVDRYGELLDTIDTPDRSTAAVLLRRWMLSGIAAIFANDDVQMGVFSSHGVLTLVGRQGLGKSRWLASLLNDPSWFADGISLNVSDKDSVLEVIGHWIVELGEIDSTFKQNDVARLKGFVTKAKDILRPAYAKKANKYSRKSIMCGSVNVVDFLQDKTGNRRFWCIFVNGLNHKHSIDVQQLWAQVYADWLSGEDEFKRSPHWLLVPSEADMLEASNKQYESIDPLTERFEANYVDPNKAHCSKTCRAEHMSATAICENMGLKNPSKADTNALSSYLLNEDFARDSRKRFYVARIQGSNAGSALEFDMAKGLIC